MTKQKNKIVWNNVRNLYVEWVSKTELRNFFSNELLINGFSLWWVTTLVSKDNVNNKTWYVDLKKNLYDKKSGQNHYNKFKFSVIFVLKFIKNFIYQIIWLFLIKLISYTRLKNIKKSNCFHSYNYNFFWDEKQKTFTDRCYKNIFKINNKNNFYLINIINKSNFFQNYVKYKTNKNTYIIADEYVSFSEIFQIYLNTLTCFFKLLKYLKDKNKIFFIKNKNCKGVLEPFLLSSFSGEIQNSIIMAHGIKNFYKKNKIDIFINYGEFTPGYRSIYYFLKNIPNNPKIITIQHSNSNYNLLYTFNKKNEFSNNKKIQEGKYFSPSPDIYLTHGKQFNDLLSKYFAKNLIIGPIKYDHHFVTNKKKKIIKKNKKQKNILICPSIGDEDTLLNMLQKSVNQKHKFIISPHPTFRHIVKRYKKVLSDLCNFSYSKQKTTYDLLYDADLVVCGFSSIADEAMIAGIPALRILDLSEPFYHDPRDKIKIISHERKLKKILSRNNFSTFLPKDNKKIKNFFYYKLDNKASTRFWKIINKLK